MVNSNIYSDNYDIEGNISNWKKYNNILFITGAPGSGKSTLSKKISNLRNVTIVELDSFEWYISDKSQNRNTEDYQSEFLVNYFEKHSSILNVNISKDYISFRSYFNHYFYELMDHCYKDVDNYYIFNGVQIFLDLFEWKWLIGKPYIIKGTSSLESIKRKFNRDGFKISDLNVSMHFVYAYKFRKFEKWIIKNG